MKKVVQLLVSGLIGIGIGMTWIVVQILLQSSWNNLANSTLKISDFLFWILESFLIGIFFYLAGWIFNNDSWSLRKQIIINFFVCLTAWLVFNFFVDGSYGKAVSHYYRKLYSDVCSCIWSLLFSLVE